MDGMNRNEEISISHEIDAANVLRKHKIPSFKQIFSYTLLIIFLVSILIRWWGQQESVKLLLWELITVFGFFAANGDLQRRKISNRLIKAMAGTWILLVVPHLFLRTEDTFYEVLDGILAFLLCGVLMTTIYLISRKGLGGGDVKFMTISGLYLGTSRGFSALLYGAMLAAISCGILLVFKKAGLKDTIPLVPFLYAGMLISILVR